jgi:hypothetical protein
MLKACPPARAGGCRPGWWPPPSGVSVGSRLRLTGGERERLHAIGAHLSRARADLAAARRRERANDRQKALSARFGIHSRYAEGICVDNDAAVRAAKKSSCGYANTVAGRGPAAGAAHRAAQPGGGVRLRQTPLCPLRGWLRHRARAGDGTPPARRAPWAVRRRTAPPRRGPLLGLPGRHPSGRHAPSSEPGRPVRAPVAGVDAAAGVVRLCRQRRCPRRPPVSEPAPRRPRPARGVVSHRVGAQADAGPARLRQPGPADPSGAAAPPPAGTGGAAACPPRRPARHQLHRRPEGPGEGAAADLVDRPPRRR